MHDASVDAGAGAASTPWSSFAPGAVPSALAGIRVLDLSGLAGQYCGKQFADLGAEVILVEPVTGSPVRHDGPFLDDRVHIEYSLQFAYFNALWASLAVVFVYAFVHHCRHFKPGHGDAAQQTGTLGVRGGCLRDGRKRLRCRNL